MLTNIHREFALFSTLLAQRKCGLLEWNQAVCWILLRLAPSSKFPKLFPFQYSVLLQTQIFRFLLSYNLNIWVKKINLLFHAKDVLNWKFYLKIVCCSLKFRPITSIKHKIQVTWTEVYGCNMTQPEQVEWMWKSKLLSITCLSNISL